MVRCRGGLDSRRVDGLQQLGPLRGSRPYLLLHEPPELAGVGDPRGVGLLGLARGEQGDRQEGGDQARSALITHVPRGHQRPRGGQLPAAFCILWWIFPKATDDSTSLRHPAGQYTRAL